MRALTAVSGLVLATVLLVASTFVGFLFATAGTAVHPPLVRVAAPLACEGSFEIETRDYSYKPGQSGTEHRYWCTGADGTRESVTMRAIGYAFLVYSGFAFGASLLLALPALWWIDRNAARWQSTVAGFARRTSASARRAGGGSPRGQRPPGVSLDERLRQLRGLHEAGLITPEDYERRKAELLAEL